MPADSGQEKTEKATPKKREKAREEGQVAKSVEISSVSVLFVGVTLLFFFINRFGSSITEMMRLSFTFDTVSKFDIPYCINLLQQILARFFRLMLPIMGVLLLTGLVFNFIQVGFHISFKAIEPKLSKFNFIKGFGRFFSIKSLGEMIKSVVKLLIIGFIAYHVIKWESSRFPHLYYFDPAQILAYILKGIYKLFIWVTLVMVVLAVLDYAFQRWQFEEQLKMTKQEVKEEHKQAEGDPQVKSRIRSIQYQAARRRMMQQIPEADVVVTNPIHLALAIRYSVESMAAPQVVAKGAGRIAERIKEVASAHGVPVIENKKLAQNLYRIVDIGEEIPLELYQAVAELLAYVYKFKGKTAR